MDNIKELFSNIGQCLFLTQRIESLFKFIFPFVSDGIDSEISVDIISLRSDFIKHRTLGQVIGALKLKEFHIDERTSNIISEFIDMRNQFVHHEFSPSHFSINSQEDLNRVREFLDKYLYTIKVLYDIFEPIMLSLAECMIPERSGTPAVRELKELVNNRLKALNIFTKHHFCDNSDEFLEHVAEAWSVREGRCVDKSEVWEKTAIIKAIFAAMKECPRDADGWVLLSSCAMKMMLYTEFRKEDYNFKKLIDVIRASELFEIRYECKNRAKAQARIREIRIAMQ